MCMAQKVSRYSDNKAEDLDGDVPARAHEAEEHASGKYNAPGEGLDEDVGP